MKKAVYPLALFCVMLFFNTSVLQAQKGNKTALWNKVFDRIAMSNPLPAFYVAVVDKTGIGYRYAHGNEIWSKEKQLDENSTLRIYSMTKALTAVAAMQLVEQG